MTIKTLFVNADDTGLGTPEVPEWMKSKFEPLPTYSQNNVLIRGERVECEPDPVWQFLSIYYEKGKKVSHWVDSDEPKNNIFKSFESYSKYWAERDMQTRRIYRQVAIKEIDWSNDHEPNTCIVCDEDRSKKTFCADCGLNKADERQVSIKEEIDVVEKQESLSDIVLNLLSARTVAIKEEKAIKDASHYKILGNLPGKEQDGINPTLLDLWGEVENFYGDPHKVETGRQLLLRLQEEYIVKPALSSAQPVKDENTDRYDINKGYFTPPAFKNVKTIDVIIDETMCFVGCQKFSRASVRRIAEAYAAQHQQSEGMVEEWISVDSPPVERQRVIGLQSEDDNDLFNIVDVKFASGVFINVLTNNIEGSVNYWKPINLPKSAN